MIVIAVTSLAVFHPGWCFPQLSKNAEVRLGSVETIEKARSGSQLKSV